MEGIHIVTFQCPNDAAMAQRELLARELKAAMMPTPRDVSASCGLALRFNAADLDAVRSALYAMFPEPDRCRFFAARMEQGRRVFYPIGPAK